ncbi:MULTISPECIES: PEP/pyruvate-binding domain-containing protein [unclassified Bacteroides]|jgi:CheY-like chemotaxis protein|uniref:PEP/pyruvate-binding domain-containing protein n=1 Tax=unclassified Bacteroides TaxID=2646097 RepID=UPI000E879978|nr:MULTISPECIES: PEP/pyruvate-binding domain-containing protein [unclassified Bacteroides]RGN46074.1 phosphoenolpyruvate synthase [Bacteroides sp. OM05-12]RHR74062.1 phosphoenolpyruvate synthase [Bacteroides sp. AF16-49]
MLSKLKLSQLYFKDTSFVNLMTKRIFNVLLIANPYDAFMLEDDGRIDEKIFNEYTDLSLRYPPRFTQVSTEEEAWKQLANIPFDLVICMPGTDNSDTFQIARSIKAKYEHIPLVVLTPFSHGITKRIANEDLSAFEYVFCWLGNTDLLLSIIKLIEDKMNLEHDVKEVGVQMILLVEDSIRFYSSVLPYLFKFVLKQSQEFSTEALNAHQQTLRMRGRPKIALARTYEEAMELYEKYADNILGVITDVRFPRKGEKDALAGIKLCSEIRKKDEFVPLIIQSSETENKVYAARFNASFIDKNSKKMNIDLRRAVSDNFGFGDFIFRNPDTMEEIARVRNLKELQNVVFAIPKESFLYHISRNHVSRWLYSRAMFPVAEFLKQITWDSLQDVDAHRRIIFDAIVKYRKMKNQGVVAVFKRDRFDRYSNFARIGDGSLGGKGRGLAFIDNMIKHHPEFDQFENAQVAIPKTVVLCTDVFDEFMDTNNLYQIALSDADDDVILKCFLKAKLPDRLVEDFFTFFDVVKSPIAIRSSSLLEDSHYQPFAGIYSTYMIPYLDDKYEMLRMLSDAIKGVYASVYYRDSKAYMQATSNVIDQEKMAVILQEVVGNQYGDRYYPSMSGVARSLNYYPIGDEKPEEGTVNLALGLGKYIVDGGMTLRFSPYHPNRILQTSEIDIALRETQTQFYVLDMKNIGHNFSIDDGFNLLKLHVKEAEKDGSLRYIASTFDPYDQIIRDGYYPGGRKLITFANILQHDVFPLARILQLVLEHGQNEMRRPVEIEFAATLNMENGKTGTFYLLQIRPIVDSKEMLDEDLSLIKDEDVLLRSENSLGHGIMNDIQDVIYVKTDGYSASNNQLIAYEIEKLNREFLDKGKSYILVGPGRWGSSDTWLGIPVKWPHISAARVIVEAGLTNYRVDPSQGTHFFQNLTSFGVGYFTINAFRNDGVYNQEFLNNLPAEHETQYLRHVHFDQPLVVKMDGKKNKGAVMLPGKE